MKLVIWDCDGVLVDSEIIVNEVFVKLLSTYGITLSIDECLKAFTGKNTRTIYSELSKMRGSIFSDHEIEHIQGEIENELAKSVCAIPGVQAVLDLLTRKQIRCCVASSSRILRIQKVLIRTELIEFFKPYQIFSSTMVQKGKPAPDLFLHAASAMKVRPKDSLVIEDSVAGIQAAKAAGMKCVAFLGATHAKYPWYYDLIIKEKPTTILERMKDLENFINESLDR